MKKNFYNLLLLCTALWLSSVSGLSAQSCTAKMKVYGTGAAKYFFDSSSSANYHKNLWTFGDGTSSDAQKYAVHTYAKSGKYYVCLKITDTVTLCSSTVCDSVSVTVPCKASWSLATNGYTVNFTDKSTADHYHTCYWTFGDGSNSSDRNPTHTFSKVGTFQVCLKITDTVNKCTNTVCDSIKVLGCAAKYSYKMSGTSVSFTDLSSTVNGHSCTWFFGDGTSATGYNPTHNFSKAGNYYVCLKVTDTVNKCYNYHCDTIKVIIACSASYSFSYTGLTATFLDKSTSADYHKCSWSFGDTSYSTAKNPQHTYARTGKYQVCLKITDTINNCTSTICDSIRIQSCTSKYSYKISGSSVTFTDQSSTINYHNCLWIFGDGTTSDSRGPTHTYSKNGTYIVYLKVIDTITKCFSYYHDTIRINSACQAEFSYSLDSSLKVRFTNKSTAAHYYTSTWSFGDGKYSSDKNPTHVYGKDSTYKVCMYITDTVTKCVSYYCATVAVSRTYSISGYITAGTNSPYPGTVWLIVFNKSDSSLKAIRDTRIKHDSTGSWYLFNNVAPGTYYTKVALDTTSNDYHDYLPTYHNDAIKWATAQSITVTNANVSGKDIKMKAGTNPGGKGFIGGRISQGANKVGDPLGNIEIMLLNVNSEPVAYTYSDSNGNFKFNNLAYGTYQVYPEVIGIPTTPAIITISDGMGSKTDVEMKINSTHAYPVLSVEKQPAESVFVRLYPNPAADYLHLSYTNTYSQLHLSIFDITGKLIISQKLSPAPGVQDIELNISHFHSGLYLINLQAGDAQLWQGRFMKE